MKRKNTREENNEEDATPTKQVQIDVKEMVKEKEDWTDVKDTSQETEEWQQDETEKNG